MEKICSFRVRKLKLAGFKKFTEPVEFEFGTMTSIAGHNSQGKSSIAEAISYAITGVPFFGGERSNDRLYAMNKKEMFVALTIEADGDDHELVRERVNDSTTVTYDGVQIKQSDLNIMFGERDVFLSMFNPLYFVEELGDKGRNLLERHLPSVSHEDVMSKLSDSNKTLIENTKMVSPEGFLKRLNEEIKELGDGIIYAEGQRDLLAEQARLRKAALQEKRDELKILNSALLVMQKKRSEGLDFAEMKERLSDLYMRLDERSRDSDIPDTLVELDTQIAHLTQSLELRKAEKYSSKFTQELANRGAQVNERGKKYRQEKTVFDALQPGIQCPTCKRNVTDEDLPLVKAAYVDSINAITAEGKELTAQLKELQELDAKSKEVFEQFQAEDVAKMEDQLEKLKADRENALNGDADNSRLEEISNLKAQIQSLELDIRSGNLTDAEASECMAQFDRMDELKKEIATLEAQEDQTPDEKAQDVENIRKTLTEKEALATAVRLYISERIRLVFENFGALLNRVSIQLYDVVKKTGEVRDVFICTYEGRPYKYLSYSEKVKAGLEISALLKKLTDSDYPVFIDNGESVPVIDNISQTGQVIFSQVVKGKPLTVTPVGASEQQTAA